MVHLTLDDEESYIIDASLHYVTRLVTQQLEEPENGVFWFIDGNESNVGYGDTILISNERLRSHIIRISEIPSK